MGRVVRLVELDEVWLIGVIVASPAKFIKSVFELSV